jgi:hypothetical protein
MSTHGCSAILFPPYSIDDTSDDGVQEQEIPGGAYYNVEIPDDQE